MKSMMYVQKSTSDEAKRAIELTVHVNSEDTTNVFTPVEQKSPLQIAVKQT